MFKKDTKTKVLLFLASHPYKEYYLREIAKNCSTVPSNAKRALDDLHKSSLITRVKKANLALFKANLNSITLKQIKICYALNDLVESGLVENVKQQLDATSIMLFGSVAKGEDDENSDIDILVISKKPAKLDLSNFEKKLGKRINLITFTFIEWQKKAKEDKPFYENVTLDGITLFGEKPVVL